MTVRDDGDVIRLEGNCPVEEAEPLTALLQAALRPIDFSQCRTAHGAVVQVVLAFGAPISGDPPAPVLRALLRSASRRTSALLLDEAVGGD